ncbi:APC family permease [Pelotomaculum sp. PtaB.Bin117]|uniref:APC family permease n=1 Tax=Pelotomaculum sp. PtaB.Bin117 TaxID=1811694 RepID=UPI0009C6C2BB|nr:APC family permease [Pelotomaculum sp. PtaB.Bin117]OPX90157.1 MAG: putative amino acid permease YhdG [Pelotomaculum sp. PtaB.Bin117]
MQLKRVLSLRTVVATSAGLTLATSTFIAAVQVAGYVLGDTAWIAILTGGILCFLAAACFSELNGLLPTANGIRLYFSRAFNDQVSLTISIIYMTIVIVGVVGAESYVLSRTLSEVFPAAPPYSWVVLLLALVTVMNLRGLKIAGVFQDVITYGLLASLVVISLIALHKVNFQLNAPLAPGGASGLINAVALGVFLFVGFEWVTPLAEEVTKVKQISRGMMIALGILSVAYAVFTVAMTAVVPKEALAASAAPHMLFARAVLGGPGAAWMVVLSLAASVTTFNAGMISVSRFMYASAREHVLPAVFSRVSMRFFTPWVSIVVLFFVALTVAGVTLFTHNYLVLVEMAAAMESIVYVLAGLAVISLRRRMPDQPRPYRIKGGLVIPVLTVLVFALLAEEVLREDKWALIGLTVSFLVSLFYVNTAVPYLKKIHEARKPAARRRPSRATGGVKEN